MLTNDSFVVAFMREQGLTQLATANGDFDRVGGMTMLVRLPVDVIVTGVDAAAQAAKDTTTTIPIVMFSGAPVETGLMASLARPGGNVTGLSLQVPETGGKRLELLKDAVPQASRVAVLWQAAYPGKALEWQATQAAARTLGVTLHSVEVRGPDDFDGAFAAIAREHPDALLR